jgi:hypothetical protein
MVNKTAFSDRYAVLSQQIVHHRAIIAHRFGTKIENFATPMEHIGTQCNRM